MKTSSSVLASLCRSFRTPGASLMIGVAVVIIGLQSAQAQATYFWDTNGATAGSGAATGTWNNAITLWSTSATGTVVPGTVTTTNADDLFFSAGTNGTGGTVTVSGTQLAHSITFDDPVAITLSGGTAINLGNGTAGSGLFYTANAANTISTAIILNSGATALNFTNSGTSLQAISGTITGAATSGTQALTLGATSTGGLNLSGVISNGAAGGNVSLNVNSSGSGFTILSGASTYTGGFTLTSGRVVINSGSGTAGSTGGATGIFTIAGGILDSSAGSNITLGTNRAQTWSGDFSFGGQAVINGAMGSRNLNLGTGAVTLTGNRTVTVDSNTGLAARATNYNLLTVGGQVQGAFRLTKSGLGTLSLTNTTATGGFNGGVTLNAGALRLAGDASAITNNNITFNGGVLEFAYAPSASYTLGTGVGQFDLTNGGGFSASGAGRSVTLAGGAITWGTTANFVGASNALRFGSLNSDSALTFTNAIDLGGATRTIDATRGTNSNNNDAILSGAITNGSIIKTGNGSVALTSVGAGLSAVTISGGTLSLSTIASLNINLNGGVFRSGADYTGALGSGNGQIRFAGGTADGGFSADSTANRTLNVGGAGAILTWNSTANFLGTGALLLNSAASGNTTVLANGLDFNGADRTIYVEDGGGAIDARIDGVISGTGGLLKSGGGVNGGARLFLTGANTYTGTTTIRNGEVLINSSVLNNTASPFGNSSSTIFITDASTLSAETGTSGGFVALYAQGLNNAQTATAVGDALQFTIARPIDISVANTTNVLGRVRIGLLGNAGAGVDTNKLTLAGNITLGGRQLELYAERAGQTIEVTSPNITGTGTVYLTGNILNNNANDGRSGGTFRFSNQARSFSTGLNMTYGTLVIEGSVAATGNSPIGTAGLSLGDGNGGNTLSASGRDAVRGVFLETAGATFDRALSPAGFGQVTPTAGAQQALYGTGATNLGNGYRIGGLNTTGTVTFSQNIAGQGVNQSVTGTAGGSGGTNALSVVHNIALIAATGGTVNVTGAITGSTAPVLGATGTPGASNATGNMTRITINQFRNHPNLDEDFNGAADAGLANALVGTSTAGTVRMSGNNTYGASTEILGGTLQLNYATNNTTKLADAAALILSGGTIDLSGGSHAEVVGSTTITGNTANTISRSNSTGAGTSTLRLNSLTRGLGGFLNFGAASITDTDTLNTNGILGAWATINRTDFAQNSTNAADGLITAYTSYTDVQRLTPGTIADGSTTNVRLIEGTGLAGSITLGAATTTINTLNQSTSGGTSAATIDPNSQTLRTNAILVGTGTGGLTLGTGTNNGTLTSATSAAGSELVLQNFSSNGLTINSVVADNTTPGNLTIGGSGATTLTGANTFTGSTLVSSGVLNIRNATALGSVSASVTSSTPTVGVGLAGNAGQAVINTTNTSGLAVGQAVSGPGIPAGSFITAIVANTSFSVSQNLTSAASTVTGAYQVGGTTVANGAALELQGVIAVGAEALTLGGIGISNGGALRNISGNNSYAGAITLTADTRINSDSGTLTLSGGIPSPAVATSAYALTFGGAGNTLVSGAIAISPTANGYMSSLTKDGTGTLILSGTNTYGGVTTISNGTLQLGNGGTTGVLKPESNLINNGAFVINRSNAVAQGTDFAPAISGTGAVTINMVGAVATTFGGNANNNGIANTYTGLTTISAGTLNLSKTTGVTAVAGDILIGAGTLNQTTSNQIADTVTVTLNNAAAVWTLSGQSETVANVNLQNSTATGSTGLQTGGSGALTVTGAFNQTGGEFTLASGGTGSSLTANTFSFTAGNFVFGNTNVTTTGQRLVVGVGGFTIGGGRNLNINSGTNSPNNFISLSGDLTSQASVSSNVILDGGGTGEFRLQNATRTFTVADGVAVSDLTISAKIVDGSGVGVSGLIKAGDGTMTLSGTVANTYTGVTTVTGGSLVLAKTAGINAIGGNLTIGDGATTAGNDIVQLTNSNQIADTSVVTFNGTGANAGILRLNNQSETLAGLSSSGGAGIVENNNAAAGTSTLTVSIASGNQTFSGILRDNGGTGSGILALTKDGVGTQVLTGTNTYTGATTVTNGALQIGNAGVGQTGSGAVTVASGGTIFGTGSVRGNTFDLQSGSTLRPGDGVANSSHGTLTFTPVSASGSTSNLQGNIILGISTPTTTDATFGGNALGSAGYNAWADAISGTASHDRLVFGNPTTGTGYNLNFLTTTGSLQVIGSSFTPEMGQAFNLLDWSNLVTTNFSGFTFNSGYLTGNGDEGADLDLPDISSSGLLWDFSRFTTSGVVVVVPEPSRALLIIFGFAGLMLRRRRL